MSKIDDKEKFLQTYEIESWLDKYFEKRNEEDEYWVGKANDGWVYDAMQWVESESGKMTIRCALEFERCAWRRFYSLDDKLYGANNARMDRKRIVESLWKSVNDIRRIEHHFPDGKDIVEGFETLIKRFESQQII